MTTYRKAIFIYGVVLPLFAIGVPLFIILIGYGKFAAERDRRHTEYQDHLTRVSQIAQLEKSVKPREPEIAYIKSLVGGDIQARLDRSLVAALATVSANELERTYRDFPLDQSPLAQSTQSGVQKLVVRYAGRFEPMELASLHLEVDTPNLFVEDFKMEPSAKGPTLGYEGPHLQFEVTYGAWKE